MTKPKVRKRARKPNTPSAQLRAAVEQLLRDKAPNRLTFNEVMAALLRSGYRFSDTALKNALADYREPHVPAAPPPPNTPIPSGIAVDAAMALHRYEVDAVEVESTEVLGCGRVRIDKVADEQKPYWLSAWVEQIGPAMEGGDWRTLSQWRLPLVALNEPSRQLPGLAVQLFPNANAAADCAQHILQGVDQAPGRYTVTFEECSPAEADRRLNARGLLARRHGTSGTGTSRTAGVSCLKCGLPLSDPASVKIGIGPECRRRLGDDVIQALRGPTPQRRELIGAKRPKQWAITIRRIFEQVALRRDQGAESGGALR